MPSRIRTVRNRPSVTMYNYQPFLLAKSSIPKQNCSHRFHVICDGSPSRIRSTRRISLGITIRPRSSIRRTIPVAFTLSKPFLCFQAAPQREGCAAAFISRCFIMRVAARFLHSIRSSQEVILSVPDVCRMDRTPLFGEKCIFLRKTAARCAMQRA